MMRHVKSRRLELLEADKQLTRRSHELARDLRSCRRLGNRTAGFLLCVEMNFLCVEMHRAGHMIVHSKLTLIPHEAQYSPRSAKTLRPSGLDVRAKIRGSRGIADTLTAQAAILFEESAGAFARRWSRLSG
jgi:hypothetical protein